MSDWGANLVQFTNMHPVFKGSAVTIVGLIGLLFALWMNKRWKEPLKGGLLVFTSITVVCLLYGLFVLIFQPQWWKLPY